MVRVANKSLDNLVLVSEKDYSNTIEAKIRPYLESISEKGFMHSDYGHEIYYEHFSILNAKGCVVILHGFTEGIRKYSEVIYTFIKQGYEVFMIEHFGHGSSTRSKEVYDDFSKVSVDDFEIYTDDVIKFTKEIVKGKTNCSKLILFGHSMGGGIATRVVEKEINLFNCCVLSSPMIGVNMGGIPNWIGRFLSSIMVKLGKKYDYVFGHHKFRDDGDFERSPDKSRERYNYFEKIKRENDRYKSNGATWAWVHSSLIATSKMIKDAKRIVIPILLLQAESDQSVRKDSQEKFSSIVDSCDIVEIKGSKHEIMFSSDSVNRVFWSEIFSFLSKENK